VCLAATGGIAKKAKGPTHTTASKPERLLTNACEELQKIEARLLKAYSVPGSDPKRAAFCLTTSKFDVKKGAWEPFSSADLEMGMLGRGASGKAAGKTIISKELFISCRLRCCRTAGKDKRPPKWALQIRGFSSVGELHLASADSIVKHHFDHVHESMIPGENGAVRAKQR
jgi:hypothetical protein